MPKILCAQSFIYVELQGVEIYRLLDLELRIHQTDQCETDTIFHHHGN